ncbi:putative F-box protein At3g17500 [Capsella rubella]|uniref:putative F-box protein At3g17500 n=1 Tax=Capsella rubella TaxID=81985 RepID=UPI000CD49C45|nr:putative F-box protein At3g17500 [Capsella rubella]
MSDLPQDVVDEILSCVPATSLKQLRSTCKHWNALQKDQRFTKKHFGKASKQFLVFMLHEEKFFSLSFNLHDIDNNVDDPFILFKVEHGLTQKIKQVLSHCDGLLLCSTKKDKVVVCNPCTGETKLIRPCTVYEECFVYALGYEDNKSFRNYKILRYQITYPLVQLEIYDFTSGTWRVLEVNEPSIVNPYGVSWKGNSYWLVWELDSYLLSFDFTTESFGHLCLPFKDKKYAIALSIVREEKLSVLNQRTGSLKIDVWVATSDKIDGNIVLSWERFLVVDNVDFYGCCPFSSCVSFYVDEEKKLVVLCCDSRRIYGAMTKVQDMVLVIGECGVYREIRFGESVQKLGQGVMFNYAPSLVRIHQESILMPSLGKRKARNLSIKAVT